MHPDHRTDPSPMKNPIFVIVVGWLAGVGASEIYHQAAEYVTGEPQKPTNLVVLLFCSTVVVVILTWLRDRQRPADPPPHA